MESSWVFFGCEITLRASAVDFGGVFGANGDGMFLVKMMVEAESNLRLSTSILEYNNNTTTNLLEGSRKVAPLLPRKRGRTPSLLCR